MTALVDYMLACSLGLGWPGSLQDKSCLKVTKTNVDTNQLMPLCLGSSLALLLLITVDSQYVFICMKHPFLQI